MLGATVVALVLANSPLAHRYEEFWHLEAGIRVGGFAFQLSFLHWINDGLMALFFFGIGLEIKREILVGELSSMRKAALPVFAAVGGMVAPALIYLSLNHGGAGSAGWGIPMATDIAFSLGVLALLGSRVPVGLRVFVAALAIADDIGAILVIAAFYSPGVALAWLGAAAAGLALLALANRLGISSVWPYIIGGVWVWFAMLHSGVHATIAGVLVAFTIPVTARVAPLQFTSWVREHLEDIERNEVTGAHVLADGTQQALARDVREAAGHMQAPLQRLEHGLLPWTNYMVLPAFALANAGVILSGGDLTRALGSRVALGVLLGLFVGKQVGIVAATYLAVRSRAADLPVGVTWRHVHGGGILAGIGFTMSIFITNLAFSTAETAGAAKIAVLAASLLAGVSGYVYLRLGRRPTFGRRAGRRAGGQAGRPTVSHPESGG